MNNFFIKTTKDDCEIEKNGKFINIKNKINIIFNAFNTTKNFIKYRHFIYIIIKLRKKNHYFTSAKFKRAKKLRFCGPRF